DSDTSARESSFSDSDDEESDTNESSPTAARNIENNDVTDDEIQIIRKRKRQETLSPTSIHHNTSDGNSISTSEFSGLSKKRRRVDTQVKFRRNFNFFEFLLIDSSTASTNFGSICIPPTSSTTNNNSSRVL